MWSEGAETCFKAESQWTGQIEKRIQDNLQPGGDCNRLPHEFRLEHNLFFVPFIDAVFPLVF